MIEQHPIRASNGRFTIAGEPIVLKGFNLGSWLNIEDFMIGLSGTDWRLRAAFRDVLGAEEAGRFFDGYAEAFITRSDLTFVRGAGCNLVRLPFNYRYFEDDDEPFVYREEHFRRIDRLMDWCEELGLFVLLDFHASQGGQNNTPPADQSTVYPHLWHDRLCQDRYVSLWRAMARRYRDRPCLFGYDLLNESITTCPAPLTPGEQCAAMNRLFRRVLREIREIDPVHCVLIEGNVRSSGGIRTVDRSLFEQPNVAGTFHHYPTSAWDRPDGIDFSSREAFQRDRARLRSSLELAMEGERRFAEELGIPMLLGECGLVTADHLDLPMQTEILDTQLSVVESWGYSWCAWSLKDVGRMGILRPRPDTPWRTFLSAPEFADTAGRVAKEFAAHFDQVYIPAFGKNEANRRVFDIAYNAMQDGIRQMQLRHAVERLAQMPASDRSRMPESFLFGNCELTPHIVDALRPHLAGHLAL